MRVLLLALILSACDPGIVVTSDLHHYEPPEVYQQWFAEMQDCTGERWLSFDALGFYWAEAVHYKVDEWQTVNGVWIKPYDIIVRPDLRQSRRTISHEMVHALMQDGHPSVDSAMEACGVL